MSTAFKSLPGCKRAAGLNQAALANSVVHLFKASLSPSPSTPLADYTAAEADFDGYTAQTITAFLNPSLAPGSGYQIQGPIQQFEWAHVSADVANSIAGAYLVDSTGVLIDVIIFTAPITMAGPDQAILVSFVELFPTGF